MPMLLIVIDGANAYRFSSVSCTIAITRGVAVHFTDGYVAESLGMITVLSDVKSMSTVLMTVAMLSMPAKAAPEGKGA